MLPSEIVRNERGADVCHRIIKTAVPKVAGDPSRGYQTVEAYCNQPVILDISENRKMCPRCEKRPPVGNVNPRITNAAGIVLTKKELEECGVTEDTSLRPTTPVKAPRKVREAKKTVEVKVKKGNKNELVLTIALDDLENANLDIAAFLIKKASESLDTLPVTNFAESKRLIRLQEKLEALVRV